MAGEIFISYRRSDETHARLLYSLLKVRGVDAWYDAHVGAGEDWRTATAKALVRAPVFVLLFSRNAADSDDIAKELAAATLQKKLVIPVRLENIQPEGAFLYELAARNWFDAWDDTEARLAVLADRIAALIKATPNDPALGLEATPAQSPKSGVAGAVRSHRLLVFSAIGLALVAAIAITSWLIMQKPVGPPAIQRTAFFGFTTTKDDPTEEAVAETATDETFEGMSAIRLDTAARAETAGVPPEERMARARALDALYALSGEVRSDSGRVSISIRLEDVPARMTLWEGSPVAGEVEDARPLAVQAAAKATDLVGCLVRFRASLRHEDRELLRLIANTCVRRRDVATNVIPDAIELARRAPESAIIQAFAVWSITSGGQYVPPPSRPALLARAAESLARAERLDPEDLSVQLARAYVAQLSGKSLSEQKSALEKGVSANSQKMEDAIAAGSFNFSYGSHLASVGRNKDAELYFKVAMRSDPFNTTYVGRGARALAVIGKRGDAEQLYADSFARLPTAFVWQTWIYSAIFLGVGDAEEVLRLAPKASGLTPDTVDCWRRIRDAAVLKSAVSASAPDFPVTDCHSSGRIAISLGAMSLHSAIGDLDGAFEFAQGLDMTMSFGSAASMEMFWAPTRAMRSDPRFLPLTRELGLFDYWVETGTHPDICDTPEERNLPVCTELRAASN